MTVQPIVYDVSKPFPVIRCTGSARERGRQHGQQAKTQVHGSINAYKSIFLDLAGLSVRADLSSGRGRGRLVA